MVPRDGYRLSAVRVMGDGSNFLNFLNFRGIRNSRKFNGDDG
jgi:hypothetical protein